MSYKHLQRKKETVSGKIVIGIDPSKNSHQALIPGPERMQIGKTFSFRHSYNGFQNKLLEYIGNYRPDFDTSKIVFTFEIATDIRQNPAAEYMS